MTTRDLTPTLRKCKRLVLEGLRGERLANALGVGKTTAYNMIRQLVFMGQLVDITGDNTSTPRIYDDPENPTLIKKKNDPSQTSDLVNSEVGSSKASEPHPRPNKLVRFHCTGCYECVVITLGNHNGPILDKRGVEVGAWGGMANSNGSRRQYGHAELYPNESIHFTLYHAVAGPKLTITPNPRNVYYLTADTEGPAQMTEQVNEVWNLLTYTQGWRMESPVYKGTYHIATIGESFAPLLKYADRQLDIDNASVHVDMSVGAPEIEVYMDHPEAGDDIRLLYELPDRFRRVTASLNQISRNLEQLTAITAQLLETQSNLTELMVKPAYATPPSDNRGYF